MKGIEEVKNASRLSCTPFLFAKLSTYLVISAMLEFIQIKWQCATIRYITGCFIASEPFCLFCWAKMPSLGACGSYRPPHWSTGKRRQCFYLQKRVSLIVPFLHFAPTPTHNAPNGAKKEKKCHPLCYNHSYPSSSQTLTRNGRFTSRCTRILLSQNSRSLNF